MGGEGGDALGEEAAWRMHVGVAHGAARVGGCEGGTCLEVQRLQQLQDLIQKH
jgi:hypothetical protein